MRSSLKFLFSMKKSVAQVDDDALIQKLKQGSKLAFSSLYDEYVQELFNYGMQVCDDAEFVKNCIKELFVHVWTQRHDLSEASSVKSYLFRSFRKLLLEKFLNRRFTVRVINFSRAEFRCRLLANNDVFSDQDLLVDSEQLIQELAGRQAEALFLKINNRFSYHEVAFVMGLDVSTIYRLVSVSVEILHKPVHEAIY